MTVGAKACPHCGWTSVPSIAPAAFVAPSPTPNPVLSRTPRTATSPLLLFVVVFIAVVAAAWVGINVLIPQRKVAEIESERAVEQGVINRDYESLGEGPIPQDLPKITLDFAGECVERGQPLPAQWLGVLVSYGNHEGIFRSDATMSSLRSFWQLANEPYVQMKLGPAYKSTLTGEYAKAVIESQLPSGNLNQSAGSVDNSAGSQGQ